MLKRLYRIVAWFCIVAHLNLIILPHQQASAMNFDGEEITESSYPPVSFENKEEKYSSTASPIQNIQEPSEEDSSFWTYINKAKSTATHVRNWLTGAIENNLTECISLTGCVITSYLGVEPADSFLYWGAFVAGKHIRDHLRLSRDPYQKILSVTKAVAPWIQKSTPFLLLSMAKATPLLINGGYERTLEWPRSEVIMNLDRFYYGDAAPYPLNITGNQSVAVFLQVTDEFKAFYGLPLDPTSYSFHYHIPGSELDFNSDTHMLKIVTNQAANFLSHLSFEVPYIYPYGKTIELDFQLTTNLSARFNDPGMTLVKHKLHILQVPVVTGLTVAFPIVGVMLGGGVAVWRFYGDIKKQINDYRQNAAWESIQYENTLDMNLFNLCYTINKNHDSYAEVIKIQANCLHQMLRTDSIDSVLSEKKNDERLQDILWQYVQTYKDPLNAVLFDVCSCIKKYHINYGVNYNETKYYEDRYKEAINIQVDCLHQALNEPEGKDLLLQTLLQSKNTIRGEEIAQKYIQKYKGEMIEKEPRALFTLSRVIENRTEYDVKQENASDTELTEVVAQELEEDKEDKDEESLASHTEPLKKILETKKIIKSSPYQESLSLQTECLLKILAQESSGRSTDSYLCLKLIDEELADEPNRRQDLIFCLIDQTNLHLETRLTLCDQFQKAHPGYNKAMIHKANLIIGANEMLGDERFKQAMLVLFDCQNDVDAQAFRDNFCEDYWRFEVGEDLPKVLKKPQNEEELKDFMSYAEKQKQNI